MCVLCFSYYYSTPSLNYSVDDPSRRRRRVSPVCSSGLDRPRTCTSETLTAAVSYTFLFGGSSSLSPCGLVVALRSVSVFLHCLSLVPARLDVREFYDLYWISTTNPLAAWIPKISSIRDRARFPCCVGCYSSPVFSADSHSIPASQQTGSRENITHSGDDSSFCFIIFCGMMFTRSRNSHQYHNGFFFCTYFSDYYKNTLLDTLCR